MNEFDGYVKHELKAKKYARYTDDFIIVSCDRVYLEALIPCISSYLRERLALELHPGKVSIRKFSQGIDFLGYVLLPQHVRLRGTTKRRMMRKLVERIRSYRAGEIGKESLEASLRSYLGVISHADGFGLKGNVLDTFWFYLKE